MFSLNRRLVIKISRCNASSLVIAEHDGNKVTQGTLACITAANKISDNVTILISGSNLTNVINSSSKINGIKKILSLTNAVRDSSHLYLIFSLLFVLLLLLFLLLLSYLYFFFCYNSSLILTFTSCLISMFISLSYLYFFCFNS